MKAAIVLCYPSDAAILPTLLVCFSLAVLFLVGCAAGSLVMVAAVLAAGGLTALITAYWLRYQVIFEEERVCVKTIFSERAYSYKGMSVFIRRHWTQEGLRMRSGSGNCAIIFRKGVLDVVRIPRVMASAKEPFQAAVKLLEELDIPRAYL